MGVLVLFGAGASAFSTATGGNTPPLGDHLFKQLRRNFPSWAGLPDEVVDVFERHTFEPGMLEIRQRYDHLTPALLRDMGLYFLGFGLAEDSHYRIFATLVDTAAGNIITATLNYDLLLEMAFSHTIRRYTYHTRDGDITKDIIIKLHGSPNILPPIEDDGGLAANNGFNYIGPLRWLPREEAIAYLLRGQAGNSAMMVPSIAMYAPGKEILYGPHFPQEQQRNYALAVQKADRVLILGARLAADPHVWEPLASAKKPVIYVNPSTTDAGAVAAWAAEHRVPYEHIAGGFPELLAVLPHS